MLQIKNLSITHKKDLREIIKDFSCVLNYGDKAVIIGEEGNGKSTLMKWIYDPELAEEYVECVGERILGKEKLCYLPQELPLATREMTIYEFFAKSDYFFDYSPKELVQMTKEFHVDMDFFYREQKMGTLSGGEKIKAQMMRILLEKPTVLLLDEPSNDIDITTLELLENLINNWEYIALYISHDETLIENTANMVIHLEQLKRKTEPKFTVAKMPYRQYVEERLHNFDRQEQQALNERREKRKRDERFAKIYQDVQTQLASCSRQAPSVAKNLKDKMHSVKAMGKRFEREDENMTEMPEQEEAIFFKLGTKELAIPAGKTVIEYELEELLTPDGERVLAKHIKLEMRGSKKVCIVGNNGTGKTTLMKKIATELLGRKDIHAEYIPQNYEDILDMTQTPVDFLDTTGDKEERTRIRTYLGSLKYTADEMERPISELSGGQKAKVLLLKMSLSKTNVLILDEPTRNFSPLSGPVIRKILSEFPGAIISISHDRKYMDEVCDIIYELTEKGLVEWENT
ncbi:MAG: ABC-F family ATP-binding cassette domain-containing protein [Lachnospiraceae bacterium]|nr:ABC-F family ATP-binding cassette domain-containing protein [Lachnospiraceae bacterium]